MHTHHKILWSIALLACGSFLTPVKGSPPIENNLTQAVSSVSTDVGKFAKLLPDDVHSQLTNTNISGGNTLGAIPRLDSSVEVLATAVQNVETAVGNVSGVALYDVYKQLTNTDPNHQGAIPRLYVYKTGDDASLKTLAGAITTVQGAVGNITTDIAATIIQENNKIRSGFSLTKAVLNVQMAIGNVDGVKADDFYKQLTNTDLTEPKTLGAIPKLQSDGRTLAQAIGSVSYLVGGQEKSDFVTNVRNATKALTGSEEILAKAVTAVQGCLKIDKKAIPGNDVLAQLDSLLRRINARPGTTIFITVPPGGFSNLYALYEALV